MKQGAGYRNEKLRKAVYSMCEEFCKASSARVNDALQFKAARSDLIDVSICLPFANDAHKRSVVRVSILAYLCASKMMKVCATTYYSTKEYPVTNMDLLEYVLTNLYEQMHMQLNDQLYHCICVDRCENLKAMQCEAAFRSCK